MLPDEFAFFNEYRPSFLFFLGNYYHSSDYTPRASKLLNDLGFAGRSCFGKKHWLYLSSSCKYSPELPRTKAFPTPPFHCCA